MKPHGLALVTAGEVDPVDLPLIGEFAQPGFADAEVCGGLWWSKQGW